MATLIPRACTARPDKKGHLTTGGKHCCNGAQSEQTAQYLSQDDWYSVGCSHLRSVRDWPL
jgi:hypothetical protein